MHSTQRFRILGRHAGLLAIFILAVETVVVLLLSASANAAITVAYLQVQPEPSYTAARVYAGQTVAGRASELGFKHGGEVAELLADIGAHVTKGELLARLDTDGLDARLREARADAALAAANLEASAAQAELARQTEARFRQLRDAGHASAQLYDEQRLNLRSREAEVSVARANLQRARAAQRVAEIAVREAHIHAPFAGVVQSRYVDEGTQVRPGGGILRLVETGRAEAHVGLPEALAVDLETESVYQIRWEGRTYPAELMTVLPELDRRTRTLTAVFDLHAAPIPIGAVIELTLQQHVDAPGFWLPLTALTESDRGLWGVYVVNDESQVERRLVEVVHSEAERAFVRGTLRSGDRVVSTGVQRIVPGQTVTPVNRG